MCLSPFRQCRRALPFSTRIPQKEFLFKKKEQGRRSSLGYSIGAEALADDFAGVGDEHKGMGVNLLALLAQADSFPTAHGGEHHLAVLVGEGALAVTTVELWCRSLMMKSQISSGLGGDDGEEFAQVDALNDRVHHKGLEEQPQQREHACFDAKEEAGRPRR